MKIDVQDLKKQLQQMVTSGKPLLEVQVDLTRGLDLIKQTLEACQTLIPIFEEHLREIEKKLS